MATAHLPLMEAILTGGLPTLTMACGASAKVGSNGRERVATPAAGLAAAVGRGGTEALAGGNNV